MMQQLVANVYNPHEQSKQELIDSFVVRCKLFQQLFHEIKTADMTHPQQHYLIEGQRGSGKTTLLLRLSYEIENDAELRARMIPVVLKEEAYYGITRLFKLWEKIAQELETVDVRFKGLYDSMTQAYDERGDYERECFQRLLSALAHGGGLKLILFLDNLGETFRNFNEQESHRLREILMTCPHLRMIGATSVMLEAFFRYEHAFYEFFKNKRLEGLNQEDTRNLLRQLATTYGKEKIVKKILKTQPGRVESLRILTGGVIRTIVLLFEIFIDDENGNAISDLEKILDRVTPLYKHRMDDLQPLQREIAETLALRWDAMETEEIVRATRHSATEVATLLAQLEKVFIVQRLATTTDRSLYCLQERFFNIWYLMRNAPKGNQRKVIWLTRFLEAWYAPSELAQRAKAHLRAMQKGSYHPKGAYYLTEALSATGKLDMDSEYKLIQATRTYLQKNAPELVASLSPADKELLDAGFAYYQNHDYASAIETLLRIKNPDGSIFFGLGIAFAKLKDFMKAEQYYLMAVEQGHADAMKNLGGLYHTEFKDMAKAEQYYLMAVEHDNAGAMHNLGVLYDNDFKDAAKAEQYYLMAVEQGNAGAMHNLGVLYDNDFKDAAKAEQYYLMAVEHGDADAMVNLGALYHTEFKDVAKAEQYYLMAVERGQAGAMHNLGVLYDNDFKDVAKAEQYYLMAVEHGDAEAMVNLGVLYDNDFKDVAKAEQYYLMAVEHDQAGAMYNLGLLYHTEFKDVVKAEQYYLMAIEKENTQAFNELAWLYFEQKVNKEDALRYAQQAVDQGRNIYNTNTLACILVWHQRYDEAVEVAKEFINATDIDDDIIQYLVLLLAHAQYQAVQTYFDDPALHFQERFKPLYYALLTLTNHPDAAKMPPELAEPVSDILKQITAGSPSS